MTPAAKKPKPPKPPVCHGKQMKRDHGVWSGKLMYVCVGSSWCRRVVYEEDRR